MGAVTNDDTGIVTGSGAPFQCALGDDLTPLAGVIEVSEGCHFLTGAGAITTISWANANAPSHPAIVYLIQSSASTCSFDTGGNITGSLPTEVPSGAAVPAVWTGTDWHLGAIDASRIVYINPAFGDGTTDATAEVTAKCVLLQAMGGGVLIFPPGTYRLFTGMSAGPGTLGNFSNLHGITILGYGAVLAIDSGFTYTLNVSGAIFAFSTTVGITVDGFEVTGPAAPYTDGAYKGVAFIVINAGCRNITLGRNSVNGAGAGIIFSANGVAGANKYSNVDLGQLEVKNAYYGVNGQWGPDNMRGQIITENVTRSYFVYGCSAHNVTVRSKNPGSNDAFIASAGGFGCQDITLDYFLTDTGTMGAGASGVLLDWDVTPGYLRDITVRLHCTFGGGGSGALLIQKTDGAGAYDIVDRGHTLTNLKVSGYVNGQPVTNAFGVIGTNPSCDFGASGTPDVWSNIELSNLKMTGQTSPSIWHLGALVDQITLENVSSVRGIRLQQGLTDTGAPKNGRIIARDNNNFPNLYDLYATDSALGVRMISVTADRAVPLGWFGGDRIVHNKYAGGIVKLTLPTATPGLRCQFANFLASASGVFLRLDPNGSEVIRGGGAGKYKQLSDTGDTFVTLRCATAGTWEVEYEKGTTSFEP